MHILTIDHIPILPVPTAPITVALWHSVDGGITWTLDGTVLVNPDGSLLTPFTIGNIADGATVTLKAKSACGTVNFIKGFTAPGSGPTTTTTTLPVVTWEPIDPVCLYQPVRYAGLQTTTTTTAAPTTTTTTSAPTTTTTTTDPWDYYLTDKIACADCGSGTVTTHNVVIKVPHGSGVVTGNYYALIGDTFVYKVLSATTFDPSALDFTHSWENSNCGSLCAFIGTTTTTTTAAPTTTTTTLAPNTAWLTNNNAGHVDVTWGSTVIPGGLAPSASATVSTTVSGCDITGTGAGFTLTYYASDHTTVLGSDSVSNGSTSVISIPSGTHYIDIT